MRIPGFRSLARLAALVCLALALVWGLAPDLLLAMWDVDYSYPAGLVSRRGAALFLGVGVMFYCARDAGPSPARSAMVAGFVAGCAALALLGMSEFVSGHAGPGILLPVCFEIVLALLYALSLLKDKTT